MSIFHIFDLLKSPIFFLYKGHTTLSTNIGLLTTLGLLVFLINTTINSDFFHKKHPIVSLQTDYVESFGRMAFDRSNFTITVKIQDYFLNPIIDYSYFFLTMDFTFADPTTNTFSSNTKYMKICEESDFGVEERKLNLSGKSFCPAHTEPLILQGSTTSTSTMGYSFIHVKKCNNESSQFYNVTCKSKEQIDQFFENKIIYLYLTNNKFDLTNLDSPVMRTLDFQAAYFYPNIMKTTGISVQKTIIHTETSFLFFITFQLNYYKFMLAQNMYNFGAPNTESQETFSIGEIKSDISFNDQIIQEFVFFSDKSTLKMTRSYTKLQDLLAILGGISSAYLMIANILISNYRKFLVVFELFLHLYEIPDLKKDQITTNSQKKNNIKIKKIKKKNKDEKKIEFPLTKTRQLENSSQEMEIPEEKNNKIEIPITKNNEIMGNQNDNNNEKETNRKNSSNDSKIQKENVMEEEKNPSKSEADNNSVQIPKINEINELKLPIDLTEFPKLFVGNSTRKLKKMVSSEFSTNKKTQTHFRYLEYLKFQIKSFFQLELTSKEKYMKQASMKFVEEMDILKILEKLKEIDKLKSIIFDPFHGKLFKIFAQKKIEINVDYNPSPLLFHQPKENCENRFGFDMEERLKHSIKILK